MSNSPSTPDRFSGNFTQQEAIPEDAIEKAIAVMRSGRLHRYNVAEPSELSETALLETEFAAYQNQRYALALASGGYAMQTALRAINVQPGEPVLTNAFTLSPVPGAIDAVGGNPVLIETTSDLVIDLAHLETVAKNTKARILMLSHMRGHIVDMDAVIAITKKLNITLIEDCAHTMGATFGGIKSGCHGDIACFSTQTYKHINSGEGGFLTTNDDALMARSIVLSGSYMLYERHAAGPPPEAFKDVRLHTPNCSGRMDNLRAAILRPQLQNLDKNCIRWNERFARIISILKPHNSIALAHSHEKANEVCSSFQFSIPNFTDDQNQQFLANCLARGVELKWFGANDPVAYTSRYESWAYVDSVSLEKTNQVLHRLYDCRIPLTFSIEDCEHIATIITEEASNTVN